MQILYQNFTVEVQPVFEQEEGSFKYPDTYNGGSWKLTKPRDEIKAMKEFIDQKNKNLRKLCKMARAWKNKHGVGMGGLLMILWHTIFKNPERIMTTGQSHFMTGYVEISFFIFQKNQIKTTTWP